MTKNNSLTTRVLQKLADITEKRSLLAIDVGDMFIERYGVTCSDVDCDEIIDTLDYGGGDITLEDVDRYMTAAGYPPIRRGKGEEV